MKEMAVLQHFFKKIIILIFLNALYLYSLSVDDVNILDSCAENNTCHLKNTLSTSGMQNFKDYCKKKFAYSKLFPLAFFYFDKTNSHAWNFEIITQNLTYDKTRMYWFLNWLNVNYIPESNLCFFYLLEEPYHRGWSLDEETNNTLSELLDHCPLLISCNHPLLSWTKKAILIPDIFILNLDCNFDEKLNELLTTPIAEDASPQQKSLLPFSKRKPKVYFKSSF